MEAKTERIVLLRELLVTQMNHWSFFPLYSMIAVIIGDIAGTGKPHISLWLVCFAFLCYIAYVSASC